MENVKMTRFLNKIGFNLKKNSPEILITLGVVGVVTSTVMACKATLKLNDVLEPVANELEKIDKVTNDEEYREQYLKDGADYTKEDADHDKKIVYLHCGIDLAKLYGPSVLLCTMSLASLIGSHVILKKRNVALAAAFQTINTGFKQYRGRVIERFGKDVDRELKYNVKTKDITTKETYIAKNGKEKEKESTQPVRVVSEIDNYSEFARFFDETSNQFSKDHEANLMFLRAQQNYFNNVLQVKGYVYLNDVYKALGIPESRAGQIVGWVYDKDNVMGDNYIDFGIYDVFKENSRDFVNGVQPVILLDFNVDGDILDILA